LAALFVVTLSLTIAEPSSALREGLVLLLEERGCAVRGVASTIEDALDLLDRERPDVALVDARLADGHGVALAREALAADPDRAIVLFAGAEDADLLFEGLDAGVRGYLLKDASPEQLIEALRRVAGGDTHLDPRLRSRMLARGATERARGRLSRREEEVLDLLARGFTGEQVADRLVLSAETVKTHIRNAMIKLEATTRVHAIAIALREGYIQGPIARS
jgi:DNA-binding NarL/FixJ family response regulator